MLVERGTQAVTKMTSGMGWALFSIPMEGSTMETSLKTKVTARGSMYIQVETFTEENSSTIKKKEKALCSTSMETAIRGNGRMATSMEKASISLLVRNKEYYTKMEARSRSSKT